MTLMQQASLDFDTHAQPFALFHKWFRDAIALEPSDPNAFALATVDSSGCPNVRIVLLKECNDEGFIFYTNFQSAKGQEINHNSNVAMNFHWKSLERQIRIRGVATALAPATADAYFATRPYLSKIGARVSAQSQPLSSRAFLEQALEEEQKRFPASEKVPRPTYWSGFCIKPLSIEFWQAHPARLHERVLYQRSDIAAQEWSRERLYP